MNVLTPREASIFACFADTAVAPHPVLPPVSRTDAVAFFDEWLALAPKAHAIGLRTAVAALELGPLALGFRHRLRRLDPPARARYLHAIERSPHAPVRQAAKALKGIAFLSYYGDDQLMRELGYDADANVRRGRQLRIDEGRP